MRKIFFAAILLLTMSLTGCGEGGDDKNSTSMKHSRVIIVGVDDEFPPICFRDDQGEIVGFDVDLAKEAAQRMGVELEFKPIDWDKKEQEITSGNIDMIWNGCVINDEYKNYMIFSKPYMDNRQILLVNFDNPKNIHSLSDTEGKVVGTQAGSISEDYINENPYIKNSFAKFVTYHDIEEGFDKLYKGELDAMIVDEIAARYEINTHPDTFEIVEDTIGLFTEIGIGFPKNNTELRDRVQKVFDEMIHDGTATKISEQWFQADLIKRRR